MSENMIYEKDHQLTEIQREELITLEVFDKLCTENGLRYYAGGGTALGTVRHNGFIPWDDDIDLLMPRSDFERIKTIPIPDGYCLEERPDYLNTLGFVNIHKIIRSNKKAETHNQYFENVGVDLIPLDGAPENRLKRKLFIYKWLLYLLLLKYSEIDNVIERNKFIKRDRKKKEALLIKLGVFFKPFIKLNRSKIEKKFYKYIQSFDYDKSKYIGCYVGRYREKDIIKKDVVGNGKRLPFEDMQISIYEYPEKYLSSIYGDFMTLPPVDKRESHGFDSVENC